MPPATVPFVDAETARFLDAAVQKKVDLVALLKSPKAEAKKAGLEITDSIAKQLKRLSPRPGKADQADMEVLGFFNRVVVDGRFINQFLASPSSVAKNLGVKLSAPALKRIRDYKLPELVSRVRPGDTVMSPAAVAVVVAAIIVLWSHDPRRVVIDESGRVKL